MKHRYFLHPMVRDERCPVLMQETALVAMLAASNITLIGGSTEEAPLAYKNIETVMAAQHELVNIEGTVIPRIVRMSEE